MEHHHQFSFVATTTVPLDQPYELTLGLLKSLYTFQHGIFRRKLTRGKLGKPVAGKSVTIRGTSYSLARLAWFYVYGVWPTGSVVRISDKSIQIKGEQYRMVVNPHATGIKNVRYYPQHNFTSPYSVTFQKNKQIHHVGSFRSLSQALDALKRYKANLEIQTAKSPNAQLH